MIHLSKERSMIKELEPFNLNEHKVHTFTDDELVFIMDATSINKIQKISKYDGFPKVFECVITFTNCSDAIYYDLNYYIKRKMKLLNPKYLVVSGFYVQGPDHVWSIKMLFYFTRGREKSRFERDMRKGLGANIFHANHIEVPENRSEFVSLMKMKRLNFIPNAFLIGGPFIFEYGTF